jgi:hypothetical protein
VTGLKISVRTLQTKSAGIQGKISVLETGATAIGIPVAVCVADRKAVNIDFQD